MEIFSRPCYQREVTLIGNGIKDASICLLKNIRMIVIEQAAHHDIRGLAQPDMTDVAATEAVAQNDICPWASRVHQHARLDGPP